jgi:protein-disulfide isomerase
MRGAIVAAIAAAMIGAPFLLSDGLWAKLPPPTEAEKAAAAAKAAKAAEAGKKEAELLNKSMDVTAEKYKKMQAAKAKGAPATATPTAAKK